MQHFRIYFHGFLPAMGFFLRLDAGNDLDEAENVAVDEALLMMLAGRGLLLVTTLLPLLE